MYLNQLVIKSNIRDYTACFESDDSFLQKLGLLPNAVYIIDENVWKLHQNKSLKYLPQERVIIQPVAEEMKNLDTVCELYEKIMAFAPRKNMNLVSIGGGIIQDITGFVASTLYRGINWIFVPTTLLAQVDSCIGAKTSLNFKNYKNLVGTFYPPSKIHIFPEFLKTLAKEDFYSGVGEMAKLHLMNGKEDTERFIKALPLIDSLDKQTLLERNRNCLEIKKSYIEDDEFDTGKRNMLNYGHCFGHAIESSTNFAIPHGQAVVLGMILANREAQRRGLLTPENEKTILEKVLKPILKVKIPTFDTDKTIKAMRQDKKNLGTGLALVMLTDGHKMVKITDMNESEAKDLLNHG